MRDILGYEGKRCVVVGAATGMGEACARTLVEYLLTGNWEPYLSRK